MKKKLLIFHHYDTSVGAGLCLLQIVQVLKKYYDITVCLPKINGNLNDLLNKERIKTIYQKGIPIQYTHYNGGYHRFLSIYHFINCLRIINCKKKIRRIIKNENPSIVLCNSMTLFWIGKITRQSNIKSCIYIRETYCNTRLNFRTNYIKRCIRKYFDIKIGISQFDLNQTDINLKKCYKITDKVDFSLYEDVNKKTIKNELLLPQNKKIILYVGGDSNIKGPFVLLHAMKYVDNAILVYLQHNPPSITIKNRIKYICKIDNYYKVEKFVNDNSLSEKIIFRGSTDKVEEYFTACDLVVFPMTLPHQARPIYEAGYAKKPIIISNYENIREFANEKNTILFKPNDYVDLSKKINEILNNYKSKEVKNMITNNYEKTINNHDIRTFGEELYNCINDI